MIYLKHKTHQLLAVTSLFFFPETKRNTYLAMYLPS